MKSMKDAYFLMGPRLKTLRDTQTHLGIATVSKKFCLQYSQTNKLKCAVTNISINIKGNPSFLFSSKCLKKYRKIRK